MFKEPIKRPGARAPTSLGCDNAQRRDDCGERRLLAVSQILKGLLKFPPPLAGDDLPLERPQRRLIAARPSGCKLPAPRRELANELSARVMGKG